MFIRRLDVLVLCDDAACSSVHQNVKHIYSHSENKTVSTSRHSARVATYSQDIFIVIHLKIV